MSSKRNLREESQQQAIGGVPAYRHLYEEIRAAILSGQLPAGSRLPASRRLAAEKGVSRNTALAAFEQLHAEGYIEARPGSGTYVARVLPEQMQKAQRRPSGLIADPAPESPALSERGAALAAAPRMPLSALTGRGSDSTAFPIGLPALDEFPHDAWARLYAERVRYGDRSLMQYADPAGYRPLREQIAEHVATARGIHCTADQVVIVSGSQQALEFAARILLDPGAPAWAEDPCYLGVKAALTSAGARIVPVPVDAEGIDVEAGLAREPEARVAFVTPSHQFPLGVTMGLERRLALIEWAQRTGAWVVEDDYDCEFRYRGRPLAALQAIDSHARVLYVGTFSKTMYPSLRLGYLIVPPELVDGFVAAHLSTDMHAHLLDQVVMADFLAEGHYARHVRRMRVLYGDRQHRLVTAAKRFHDVLRTDAPSGGLHLVGWLPEDVSDTRAAERLLDAGLHAWPLSLHVLERARPPALLLGYAGTPDADIAPAVRRMAGVIGELRPSPR